MASYTTLKVTAVTNHPTNFLNPVMETNDSEMSGFSKREVEL